MSKLRVLHSSDWHLGRTLYTKKRYNEFELFLNWIITTLNEQRIDLLLVAGDIFDTGTPTNRAQELYYQFLGKIATTCCKNVIITSGNHDSASFLNAPKELLQALNIHIVSAVDSEDLTKEVIIIPNKAIVVAVPYLRDRDIRSYNAGLSLVDVDKMMAQGVKDHYAKVCEIAEKIQHEQPNKLPIIGIGHLFTVGGKTSDESGERELHVGNLGMVELSSFPKSLDYLALGHLHIKQIVGGCENIRYSGSPIPMGFGEANQKKSVVIMEFDEKLTSIQEYEVPCFQKLVRIKGDCDHIKSTIEQLKADNTKALLEIEYDAQNSVANLSSIVHDLVKGSDLEITIIKNNVIRNVVSKQDNKIVNLTDLTEEEVFRRCLTAHKVPESEHEELMIAYKEILNEIYEEDTNKE